MELKAYAKINLGLDVLKRRENGYHEVRMIMQTIGLCDVLDISQSSTPGIHIFTDVEELSASEDNLIYKAAKLLFDEFSIDSGVDIKLTKNIPIAAGLAGGSTDAAATFVGVNEIFDLGLSKQDLMSRAVKIGADVPYCILGGTAIAEGIGEVLTSIDDCPECYVLIAKPPVGVSTKYVYQNLKIDSLNHPDIDAIIAGIKSKDLTKIADNVGNVLETVTIPLHPVIDEIKSIMIDNGALTSLMSGSGPTVFGLFTDKEAIDRAAKAIAKAQIAKDIVVTNIQSVKQ